MSTPEQFQAECKEMARSMRRLPKELRRALASEVRDELAEPLASKMRTAMTGPYGTALRGAVKTRVSADPKIVIGGAKRVVSGGAKARDLVFGVEFGGGKKRARIPAGNGHVGYSRRSTNQFVPHYPYAFSTVAANGPWILDTFADVVLKVIDEELPGG